MPRMPKKDLDKRLTQGDPHGPTSTVDITEMESISDRDARMRRFVDNHQVVDPDTGEPFAMPLGTPQDLEDPEALSDHPDWHTQPRP